LKLQKNNWFSLSAFVSHINEEYRSRIFDKSVKRILKAKRIELAVAEAICRKGV
jgi:hypothetical protein